MKFMQVILTCIILGIGSAESEVAYAAPPLAPVVRALREEFMTTLDTSLAKIPFHRQRLTVSGRAQIETATLGTPILREEISLATVNNSAAKNESIQISMPQSEGVIAVDHTLGAINSMQGHSNSHRLDAWTYTKSNLTDQNAQPEVVNSYFHISSTAIGSQEFRVVDSEEVARAGVVRSKTQIEENGDLWIWQSRGKAASSGEEEFWHRTPHQRFADQVNIKRKDLEKMIGMGLTLLRASPSVDGKRITLYALRPAFQNRGAEVVSFEFNLVVHSKVNLARKEGGNILLKPSQDHFGETLSLETAQSFNVQRRQYAAISTHKIEVPVESPATVGTPEEATKSVAD